MDTRVLTESDVHWIVDILFKSGDPVLNREMLCYSLGLTISELEEIKSRVRQDGSTPHMFLVLGLTKWINIKGADATVGKLNKVLRKLQSNSVADKITEELPEREAIRSNQIAHSYDPSRFWFDVPEEVSAFTGRQNEMENLHKSIEGQNIEDTGLNERTVITTLAGLGGIGKTTLAIRYAWKYYKNIFYFNVVWINAETTDTIKKSFHGLAGKLGLSRIGTDGTPLKSVELVSRIYKHFEQTSTLFIFDNVEEQERVKDYFPVKSPMTTKQYVLITSRNREKNRKTDLIVLNVFLGKDSVEFLRFYLELETDVEIEYAKKIAFELQNLPLAIRLAGAYIWKVRSDDHLDTEQVMKDYSELLHIDSERVLGFKCDSNEKTICNVWRVTLDKIERQNDLAVRIMQIISYFNSDYIPIQLLQNTPVNGYFKRILYSIFFNNTNIIKSTVLDAVKLLSQFSMVTTDSQFNISVHRLVQKVIRDDVERISRRRILTEAIYTVEVPLRNTSGCDYDQNCLILHAISILIHIQSNHLENHFKKFVDFVNSKRKDSMDVHTKRLIALLEESKYDAAEISFYITRSQYFSGRTGGGNALNEIFTAKFITSVCNRIDILDFSKHCEILKLSELCSRLLVGFKIAFTGSEYVRDFRKSADLLHSTIYYIGIIHIQHSLARTASQIYEILFDYLITGRYCFRVCENFRGTIDCFSYLDRWTDMLRLVESLSQITLTWSVSENRQFNFVGLREACDRIGEITRKIDLERYQEVQNKLFEVTLKIYDTLVTSYLKTKNYQSALECGRGRIECLTHLNRRKDVLKVITDMKVVVNLLKGAGTYDGKYELFEITKSIMSYSSQTNCTDVKTDFLEFAEANLEIIFEYCLLNRKYDILLLSDTFMTILQCLTQLNKITKIIQIWKEFTPSVQLISRMELHDEFNDISYTIFRQNSLYKFTNSYLNLELN